MRCEDVAAGAVDEDVLVAGEVVETISAGEKNSRMAVAGRRQACWCLQEVVVDVPTQLGGLEVTDPYHWG